MKKTKYLIISFMLYVTAVSAQWSTDTLSSPYSGLAATLNGSEAIFASASNMAQLLSMAMAVIISGPTFPQQP